MTNRSPGLLLLMGMLFLTAACNLTGGEATEEVLPTSTGTAVAVITEEPTDPPTATRTQAAPQTSIPPNCTPRTDWTLTYTVVARDTLARIAARGNTTIDTLAQGNCLSDPNRLSVGQVLRVPNPVTPATPAQTATSQTSACQYFTTGAPPIYETQTFLTQIETVVSEQRYPVTRINDFYYQIALPDGRRGWVQAVSGQLEGNCEDVLRYVEFDNSRAPDYECYYIGASSFETRVDQAGTTFAVELPPHFAYRVDGRIIGKVRIYAGEQVPFPVWASLNDGRIIGECDALPDVSVATTQAASSTTYRNSTYGFAFDYPENWPIILNDSAPPGGTVGTLSFANTYPSALGWPTDVVEVSWGVLPPGTAADAEELARRTAQDIEESDGRMQVLEPVASYTTDSGLAGWRFRISFPGATGEAYYFDWDENILVVNVNGNRALAQGVVESVRAAP